MHGSHPALSSRHSRCQPDWGLEHPQHSPLAAVLQLRMQKVMCYAVLTDLGDDQTYSQTGHNHAQFEFNTYNLS
jgi:hypothetical protein